VRHSAPALQPIHPLRGSTKVTSANTEPLSPPDEHLVRALVHDLDAGFVELFETYRHVVFSTALRITGRWADAEDLTAESFLRAYRALSTYRRDRVLGINPRPWLLTITLNLCRNQHRDAARKPAHEPLEQEADQAHDPPDPQISVEDTILRRETDRELAILLTALPEDQRAAVVLRHVIDLPVAEIAEILGRPAGTVKSDIARGRRRLEQALRERHPDPLEVSA
jgi:RNA polymerase sigma factor (sigma-70 family)